MSIPSGGALAALNAGIRFFLEIGALIALGYWGYRTGQGQLAKFGLALGIPLVVATIWGLVGAPAAPYRLDQPWRGVLEVGIFGAAVVALYASERSLLAVGFGIVAGINTVLLYLWGQS